MKWKRLEFVRFADVSLAKMMVWNIVNEGTDKEYIECDSCHDAEWESNKISVCAGCGGWFTVDMLHSEEPVPDTHSVPAPPAERILWKG